MTVLENINLHTWDTSISNSIQTQAVNALENGKIVFLPQLTFSLENNEKHLLSPDYTNGKAKNISYDPQKKKLRGAKANVQDLQLLTQLLDRYANHADRLIKQLFPSYKETIQIGRTSYRPVEIEGRKHKSYKKDDTRLHVDAFPANPNQGRRILRIFTNVNPHNQQRLWRVGASFEEVAKRFLPYIPQHSAFISKVLQTFKVTKSFRTHYDHLMLHMHDQMKADLQYQSTIAAQEIGFPAHSSWIVFTDQVSHAALAGQFVFEQTFYLPVTAMQNPASSPLSILEQLTERKLV